MPTVPAAINGDHANCVANATATPARTNRVNLAALTLFTSDNSAIFIDQFLLLVLSRISACSVFRFAQRFARNEAILRSSYLFGSEVP